MPNNGTYKVAHGDLSVPSPDLDEHICGIRTVVHTNPDIPVENSHASYMNTIHLVAEKGFFLCLMFTIVIKDLRIWAANMPCDFRISARVISCSRECLWPSAFCSRNVIR